MTLNDKITLLVSYEQLHSISGIATNTDKI